MAFRKRGGTYVYSVEEAEDVMLEAKNKYFWAVDDYDNIHKLQAAIDKLYNTKEGNNYEVDYQENQKGTRLIVCCGVCRKELTSYDPLVAHDNGKPHNKARQQFLVPKDPNLHTTLKRQPHNTPRDYFTEGSLEARIDLCDAVILGVQFVYKEVIRGEDTYTCQLCQYEENVQQISATRMLSHLQSNCHNKKYLRVKYGFMKNHFEDFVEEAKMIERSEGRIHTTIVDFTQQLPQVLKDGAKSTTPGARSREGSSMPESKESCRSPSPGSSETAKRPALTDYSSSDNSKPPSPEPAPAPAPPTKLDVGISVDLSDNPRPLDLETRIIMDENFCPNEETFKVNTDMQGLMIQTLYTLNQQFSRSINSDQFSDGFIKTLQDCTEKIEEKICSLDLLVPDL